MNGRIERRHFKLKKGYLNVDAEAIAFTRSGNWIEAERTVERRGPVSARHTLRVIIGMVLVGIGTAFAALKGADGGGSAGFVLAAAAGVFGFYKLTTLLQDDFTRSFRIPFAKVRALPEWKDFMAKGAFNQTVLTGQAYFDWLGSNEQMHRTLMRDAGFLAK